MYLLRFKLAECLWLECIIQELVNKIINLEGRNFWNG
jgi:hypothetical protein